MYIEDEELREIYKTVTPERLQTLEAALLDLEKNPQDASRLEEFLREAHTLKGDSRMLGVTDVETLVHQIEDLMISVKQGKIPLTAEMCDRLHHSLDSVKLLIKEAVTGESSGVNTFLVLAKLMGAQETPNGKNGKFTNDHDDNLFEEEEDLFPEDEDENLEVKIPESELVELESNQSKQQPETTVNFQRRADDIGTIRVKTEDLDNLVRQAGELSIAQLRINRRMEDINEIVNLWEEWNQDFTLHRNAIKKLQQATINGNPLPWQSFYQDSQQKLAQLGDLVTNLKNAAYTDNASLSSISNEMELGVKTLRLLPLSNIFNPLQRLVRDLSRQQGKQINLVIEGADTKADKRIIDEMKDPLLHLIRNAIDHGIETVEEREQKGKPATATILLKGYQTSGSIVIEIRDDGLGLNVAKIKQTALERHVVTEEQLAKMSTSAIQELIFASGFSTRNQVSEISGRGVGLDVVRTNVEKLKGNIKVESTPDMGCEFRLQLSTSLGTTEALLLEVNQTTYALPVDMVQTMKLIARQEIFNIEGSQAIEIEGQPISIAWLTDILNLQVKAPASTKALDDSQKAITCVVLRSGTDSLGIIVDAVLDQQDIVLKPQSALLKRVRNITGATILGNGEVCMVLNPSDLLNSVRQQKVAINSTITAPEKVQTKPKLLLVEDSIIIRTQMKRILESAGYDLTIAVDGAEGFKKLRASQFDIVVSDVEMPNMNGLELTTKIRKYQKYQELPIILVTTLAKEEDRRRGVAAGANAYLTKGDFDQKLLIDTLKRLV